jgi:eukaryotic-like serine/threonine-protein kinase
MAALPDYRFGPFELYSVSGELFREGKRVKLQEQPLRLLVALLERPGEVVPRTDLQKRIWPQDTFVDFDSSLRVAIRKLRTALGDDADNPRYIETIPKLGYRFLGPTVRFPDAKADVADEPIPAAIQSLHSTLTSGTPPPSTSKAAIPWMIAVVLMMFVLAGVAWLVFRSRPNSLTPKGPIVIADFANATGDPVFDGTLRQGLMVELGQSPLLSIMPEERIQQEMQFMGQPAGARLTLELARQVCERTGSAALLEGSIAPLGSHYAVGLLAKDCKTGQVIAQEQVEAAKKEDVLTALTAIARRARLRMGESLAKIAEHNTPLPEATTPSLEALKAYSTGLQVLYSKGDADALPLFQHATEIEPQFAMAFAQLGLVYGAIGESDLAAENTRRAYELRPRASDAERYFIMASYDARVTGNLVKAQETCEAWAAAYPQEAIPHSFLSAFIYPASGKYEKAVDEAHAALRLRPDIAVLYAILAYNDVALDRLQEAQSVLRTTATRNQETSESVVLSYNLALLHGDSTGMDKMIAASSQKARADDWLVYNQASGLAYSGHLREALSVSLRAEEIAKHASHPERAAMYEVGAALWQAFDGNLKAAREYAIAALQLSKDREVLYGAALALALSGDVVRSRIITTDLQRRFPEDTAVRFSYLPAVQSALALSQGSPSKAVQATETAVPYELGTPRSSIHGNFGALYPIYMRGMAYLASHHSDEAAAQFQKILDHRGVVLSDPMGSLARLQLGRAYAMQGDRGKSRAAYEEFLAIWKNADSDLPILAKAKEEYAELK